jgi:hypothetical protein
LEEKNGSRLQSLRKSCRKDQGFAVWQRRARRALVRAVNAGWFASRQPSDDVRPVVVGNSPMRWLVLSLSLQRKFFLRANPACHGEGGAK